MMMMMIRRSGFGIIAPLHNICKDFGFQFTLKALVGRQFFVTKGHFIIRRRFALDPRMLQHFVGRHARPWIGIHESFHELDGGFG